MVEFNEMPSVDRLGDAVYNRIRDAIISGEIKPGSRLQVPSIANSLGVSRSPVREAVIRLTNERLARDEPRKGAVVVQVNRNDLVALYEVREVLEGLAAYKATSSANVSQLTKDLSLILSDHEKALSDLDIPKHVELDTRFHRLIRQATGNHELEHMLDHIESQVRLAMLSVTVTTGPKHALDEHKSIYAAICAQDPEDARRKTWAHISRLRGALLSQPNVNNGTDL